MANSKLPHWYQDRRIQFQPRETYSCELTQYLTKKGAFSDAPITVGEVGARHGSDPIWQIFKGHREIHAFEPGEDNSWLGDAYTRRISLALWSEKTQLTIQMPEHGENASVYKPNLTFFRRLPKHEHMVVRSLFRVPATTLDQYAKSQRTAFDALSLDVQGAEWEILKGSHAQLSRNVLLVVAEVAFEELYRGQPLFRDVDTLLSEKKFKLYDLDLRRWSTTFRHAKSKTMTGQLIYGDALYFRTPFSDARLAKDIARDVTCGLKLCALAELFGAIDLAAEVLSWMKHRKLLPSGSANQMIHKISANKLLEQRVR